MKDLSILLALPLSVTVHLVLSMRVVVDTNSVPVPIAVGVDKYQCVVKRPISMSEVIHVDIGAGSASYKVDPKSISRHHPL